MPARLLTLLAVLAAAAPAHADDPHPPGGFGPTEAGADPDAPAAPEGTGPLRREDATLRETFAGPFVSSRLFAMPTADVVGAYVLSLSGEGSLLEHPGVLTSAGVAAVGFGDIAQVEYRHTEAIGVRGLMAPIPALGVQIKLPIPDHSWVPAIGVAVRLGLPRPETDGPMTLDERVSDLYIVGRLRAASIPWLALHGGTRISSAKASVGDGGPSVTRTIVLPTAGWEVTMNPRAKIIGELALAPQFRWTPGSDPVIRRAAVGRLGMRWRVLPAVSIDGSIGYQLDDTAPADGVRDVVQWDIRLGAEVFVPWGALACRATGVFCEDRGHEDHR
ncbi:MAG TPA: hypothetical protein VGM88_00490 [Kofleriaceae bacterium]|jgi:hypothetical protein